MESLLLPVVDTDAGVGGGLGLELRGLGHVEGDTLSEHVVSAGSSHVTGAASKAAVPVVGPLADISGGVSGPGLLEHGLSVVALALAVAVAVLTALQVALVPVGPDGVAVLVTQAG